MENMNEMNPEELNLENLSAEDVESILGGTAPSRWEMEMFATSVLEGMRKAKARGWTFEEYIAKTYIGQTTDPALHPILRAHWDKI